MAESTKDTVKCPQCGTESEAELWESLNSVLNYAQVERLLEGSLFAHVCPSCNSTIELTYPCLYNDMEHGTMIQYIVDENKLEEAMRMMAEMEDDADAAGDGEAAGEGQDMAIVTRIVTTHNDLREKALIFHDGFADMPMEALKAVMTNRFIDEGQITEEAECYYSGTGDSGDIVLAFIAGGRTAEVPVPRSLYDRVRAMVEASPVSQEKTYVVDRLWAQLFFQKSAQ